MTKKTRILACVIACLLIFSVATSVAYILRTTDPSTNEFTPAAVSCKVEESFVNGVKSNVTVKNTGNIAAFIRAAIVVSWVNEDGIVHAETPKSDVDYVMSLGDGWLKGDDGFYYYPTDVTAGAKTDKLIDTCSATPEAAPEGYRLNVQILATALQAQPPKAVENAWNVTVIGNNITPN